MQTAHASCYHYMLKKNRCTLLGVIKDPITWC